MTCDFRAPPNNFAILSQRSFSVSPVMRYENPPDPRPVSFKTMLELFEELISSMCGENSSNSKFKERPGRFRLESLSTRTDILLNGLAEPRLFLSSWSISRNTDLASSVFLKYWGYMTQSGRYFCRTIAVPITSQWSPSK